ncbi:MAG: hypothetical protein K0R52_717 [Alphaproteobacteria bacterium]|jgi:hypothetical protein|nr:hypothetical protein [Alphaproteobacteria bacterium]
MSSKFVPLRLLAHDPEDLTILGAHLQDALLPLVSMVYEPKNATFTLLANRFCWEHPPLDHEGAPLYHRVHAGLCFRNVDKVHHRGFQRKGTSRVLNLLTLQTKKPNAVHLICSGNHEIRIETKKIHCHLGDLHHPWPTRKKPTHIYQHVEALQGAGLLK